MRLQVGSRMCRAHRGEANCDCRDPSLHATGAAAQAPAARGRALARTRAAVADPGAARHVHRLSVRARHPAVGDQYARGCARRLRRPRQLLQDLNDGIFRTSVYNTFVYTGVTTVFKLALGLWLAMLLNRN